MAEMYCVKCKIKSTVKDSKNPVFPCDSCRRYFCGECSALNASKIRRMPIQGRSVIFNCSQCKKGKSSKILEEKILEQVEKSYEKFETDLMSKFFTELKNIKQSLKTKL